MIHCLNQQSYRIHGPCGIVGSLQFAPKDMEAFRAPFHHSWRWEMGISWISHEYLMNISWISHEYLMNISWISVKICSGKPSLFGPHFRLVDAPHFFQANLTDLTETHQYPPKKIKSFCTDVITPLVFTPVSYKRSQCQIQRIDLDTLFHGIFDVILRPMGPIPAKSFVEKKNVVGMWNIEHLQEFTSGWITDCCQLL